MMASMQAVAVARGNYNDDKVADAATGHCKVYQTLCTNGSSAVTCWLQVQ